MRDPLSESSTKRRFAIVSSDCVGWHRSSSPVTMQLLARISTASSQAGVGARSGIFGYTTEEAIGQPITMIIPKDRHLARRARTRRFGWVCRSPALSEASKSRLPSKEPSKYPSSRVLVVCEAKLKRVRLIRCCRGRHEYLLRWGRTCVVVSCMQH
jgi:hypothetical protein